MQCEESLCLGDYLSKQPRCDSAPAYSSHGSLSNSWLAYAGITNIRFSEEHISSGEKLTIRPIPGLAVNEESIPEKQSFLSAVRATSLATG